MNKSHVLFSCRITPRVETGRKKRMIMIISGGSSVGDWRDMPRPDKMN